MVINVMMMIAIIMAMTYIMTLFILVDEANGCYKDDDDENYDQGCNPL